MLFRSWQGSIVYDRHNNGSKWSNDRRGNTHDMLTGSTRSGRAFPPDRGNRTCSNWTSSGDGEAMVGHHDRLGIKDDDENKSWNSSHRSRGCSLGAFGQTGGAGLFYCFAAD